MYKILATVSLALLVGCASLNKGEDPIAVNAERSLSIALAVIDEALKFERANDVPDAIQSMATRLRKKAPDALISADRVRIAYKEGEDSKYNLLKALNVVDVLVGEARWWIAKHKAAASGFGVSNIRTIELEAESYGSNSSANWLVAVPMFIDLGKSVYSLVNSIRQDLSKTQAWSDEEDAEFRRRLLQTVTQDHWKVSE